MQWDDARIFLAIARAGSLSGASAALGLGVATVSRRLDRLESALSMPLFSRHQSGYRLTADGQALLAPAEALEQAAQALGDAAQSQAQVAGVVRLATAENLANPLIDPLHRPGPIPLRFEELERAERQAVIVGGHREMQAALALRGRADAGREWVHRHALVEGVDRSGSIRWNLSSGSPVIDWAPLPEAPSEMLVRCCIYANVVTYKHFL